MPITTRHLRPSGFTLVELMIVVAIIGVLAAVAIPNYSQYLTNVRRADAKDVLLQIASEQARYSGEYNGYAADLSALGYGSSPVLSAEGYYIITMSSADSASYMLAAKPVAGKAQGSDLECTEFILSSTGARSSKGTSSDCW